MLVGVSDAVILVSMPVAGTVGKNTSRRKSIRQTRLWWGAFRAINPHAFGSRRGPWKRGMSAGGERMGSLQRGSTFFITKTWEVESYCANGDKDPPPMPGRWSAGPGGGHALWNAWMCIAKFRSVVLRTGPGFQPSHETIGGRFSSCKTGRKATSSPLA